MFDRCLNATARIADGANLGVGRDDYLICIANSQSARVSGGRLYSRRHPVAIGGGDVVAGVPNRDFLVEGASLANDRSTVVPCGDLHGNSESCGFINCVIDGGVVLGGTGPIYRNCSVTARIDGNLAEAAEFKGGHVDLTGTRLFSAATHVRGGRGLIDFGTQNSALNEETTQDVFVDLSQFTLSAPNLAAGEVVIRVSNQGSAVRFNLVIQDGEFNLPRPVELIRTGGRRGAERAGEIVMRNLAGLPPRTILHHSEGGAVENFRLRVSL